MFKRTLVFSLVATTLAFSGMTSAEEDRSAVHERIKPVGTVTVAGQKAATPPPAMAPAAEATAPAAEEASQPVVDSVAAVETAVAEVAAPAAADGKGVYTRACFACHGTGAAGAPKLGDKAAWGPRIAAGKEALMASALNGKGAMPPKGGQMQLTDAEISASIDYMVSAAQ